jgi:circadian clock protein KaiC
LESHLVAIHKQVKRFKPHTVILDPVTNLTTVGSISEVKSMLIRLLDFLQNEGITVMFTALVYEDESVAKTHEGISSLVDAWILLRDIETNGERNRATYIMKSRGMKHSNQVREFVISSKGLELVDVYLGPEGILVGSAREAQRLSEVASVEMRHHAVTQKNRELERRRRVLEGKIDSLKEEFESVQDELNRTFVEDELRMEIIGRNRKELSQKRNTGNNGNGKIKKRK